MRRNQLLAPYNLIGSLNNLERSDSNSAKRHTEESLWHLHPRIGSDGFQLNLLGPEIGEENQSCKFGGCLLMTMVLEVPHLRVKTPLESVASTLSYEGTRPTILVSKASKRL